MRLGIRYNNNKARWRNLPAGCDPRLENNAGERQLLLPGALLVPIGAKLFAPLVFVNLAFPAFF